MSPLTADLDLAAFGIKSTSGDINLDPNATTDSVIIGGDLELGEYRGENYPAISHSSYATATNYFLSQDSSGYGYFNVASSKYIRLSHAHSTELARLVPSTTVAFRALDGKEISFGNSDDVALAWNSGTSSLEFTGAAGTELVDFVNVASLRAPAVYTGGATAGGAVVAQSSNYYAMPCVVFDQDDPGNPFAEFQGDSGASTTTSWSTHATSGTADGWLQIKTPAGAKRWLAVYTDPSA